MRKVSYLSVILFLIAAWFTIFFFWNFIEYNNYVGNIIRAGNITFRGNEYEVISYYMSSCAPYAFYALTTGVLGWVLVKLRSRKLTEIERTSIINVTNHDNQMLNGDGLHNDNGDIKE